MNRSTLLPTILLLALPTMLTAADPAEPGMAAAASPQNMNPADCRGLQAFLGAPVSLPLQQLWKGRGSTSIVPFNPRWNGMTTPKAKTMKYTVTLLITLLLVPPAALEGADVPTPAGRPNIVLFLIDDLGWRDLGCQGSTFYQTPHIDRLAREGARFTDAYAACAVCSPTRAAVLTGKYPARLLLTGWLPSGRWNPQARLQSGRFIRALPLEEFTLAEALREAGYRTASVGKWYLGSEPFSLPEHHGFDVNIAGNGHGAPGNYFFPYDGDWKIPTTDLRATWNVLPDGKPGEYLTDRLTGEAVKFIRDQRGRPFFLYLPHYGVHTPLQAKPEMIAKYEQIPEAERQGKPAYAAMVESPASFPRRSRCLPGMSRA